MYREDRRFRSSHPVSVQSCNFWNISSVWSTSNIHSNILRRDLHIYISTYISTYMTNILYRNGNTGPRPEKETVLLIQFPVSVLVPVPCSVNKPLVPDFSIKRTATPQTLIQLRLCQAHSFLWVFKVNLSLKDVRFNGWNCARTAHRFLVQSHFGSSRYTCVPLSYFHPDVSQNV